MEALVELHDNIVVYMVIIFFGLAWVNLPRPPLSVLTHAFNYDYRSGNYQGGHPVLLALYWQGSLRSKL